MMLNFDFTFEDLYDTQGLKRLDAQFLAWLEEGAPDGEATSLQSSAPQSSAPQSSAPQSSAPQSSAPQSSAPQKTSSPKLSLVTEILEARTTPLADHSDLILKLAPHLEDFLGELFQIRGHIIELRAKSDALAPLATAKRLFVQRQAAKAFPAGEARTFDGLALKAQLESFMGESYSDLAFARCVLKWMDGEATPVIPAGPRIHGEVSSDVIPAGPRIQSTQSSSRGLTTGSNLKVSLGTAIKKQDDAGDDRDDTECVKNSTECDEHHPSSRACQQTGVAIQEKYQTGLPRRADALLAMTLPHSCDADDSKDNTGCVNTISLAQAFDIAKRYAAWAVLQDSPSSFFTLPKKIDLSNLIDREHIIPVYREGFDLTDPGVSDEKAYLEAHYCIGCHAQKKDSCSKGLKEGDVFQKNTLGISLTGCPLDEKISEMNVLRQQGFVLGALATAIIDNPMVAGTGHRICNDCMKSCIFQKQDPVDIPAIETQTLDQVLGLPWGFEVYSLLSRWNPLNFERPYPKEPSGRTVLVAGMGPSGYTLAHHLMNDGHNVVGIDGLKIEPLPSEAFLPIRDITQLYENLSERTLWGFGGVAEYGITARWNKNYLKIIRLLLERRSQFALYGGVRLGSTLTLDDCTALGFDHVALCLGAGKPHMPDLKGGLPKGVRMASDFLMGLQLTGAYKRDSIANLQVRLPIVVVGGGLTALDTATEALAYYPVQVEKFLARCEEVGEARVLGAMTPEEREISETFLIHARQLRDEKARAFAENRTPRIRELLDQWGGCTVVYRRTLTESPAYRLNHEEVHLTFQQGIQFVENFTPLEIKTDGYGACRSLLSADGQEIACHTLLIAAGTAPNTVIASEEQLSLEGKYFKSTCAFGIEGKNNITFFGDLHPTYAGNVVKAMASAKNGYPEISRTLEMTALLGTWTGIKAEMDLRLTTTVHEIRRLTPTIVEVILHSPQAATRFRPGQFFRFQNFEALAGQAMEPLAMTGAWVDVERGLISLIVLEMGGSSNLCADLTVGERVSLMGPTGTPTTIAPDETVLLVGGGLGNAVLVSIGKAFKAAGSKVLYFAGYKKREDLFKHEDIEGASDQVVWCCDEAPGLSPSRPQDSSFVGSMIAGLQDYSDHPSGIQLKDIDRMITIGSDSLMAAVARHITPLLKPSATKVASINSPMQCMMKEICGQCLQEHKDPRTGEIRLVFSCANQDQDLDIVNFENLRARLAQNGASEKLTRLWLDKTQGNR